MCVRAGLVSKTATLGEVLTTAHDVSNQPFPAEEAGPRLPRHRCTFDGETLIRPAKTGLDQGPAPPDPVAVASVHKLVCTAGESSLWGILARREPRYEQRDVEMAIPFVSLPCLPDTCQTHRPDGEAYRVMDRCGVSIIDRHPSAQNAYAPWASTPGFADTPPSYVWPGYFVCMSYTGRPSRGEGCVGLGRW